MLFGEGGLSEGLGVIDFLCCFVDGGQVVVLGLVPPYSIGLCQS